MIDLYFKYKIKNKNGFSLTETLTTLIIMSFVGIMITSGMATAMRVYKQVTEYSRAQMLFSTAYTLITDDLIYADPISVIPKNTESKAISFDNMNNVSETLKSTDTIGITRSFKSNEEFPIVTYENNENFHTEWDSISFNGEYFIIKNFSVINNNDALVKLDEIKIKPLKIK